MKVYSEKSPEEKASELVWYFYNTIEHRLSEEYSPFEWNICVELATKVVDQVFEFMQNDDELHDCCHYANSPWSRYWHNVQNEINKFNK
jgi:hypothetical protein